MLRISTLVALAALLSPVAVDAKTSRGASAGAFDGRWSILVVTRQGTCDVYRWNVGVGAGRITDIGDDVARAAGRIDASGKVSVTLTRGTDVLSATGAMQGDSGSGSWRSPSRSCSGTWQAERRG